MDSLASSSQHSFSSHGSIRQHAADKSPPRRRSRSKAFASVYKQHVVDKSRAAAAATTPPTTPTRRRYQFEGTTLDNPRGVHGTILEEYTDAELFEEANRVMQSRFADWKPTEEDEGDDVTQKPRSLKCFETSEPYPFLSAEANEMMRHQFDDWNQ